jgi:plastocyanin
VARRPVDKHGTAIAAVSLEVAIDRSTGVSDLLKPMSIHRNKLTFALLLAVLLATVALGAKKPADKAEAKDDAKGDAVSIKEMKFDPATITVKPGTTVTWTNKDDHDHTVFANDESFKSGNLSHGEKFEHKFDKKGKFKYACSYHPRMKGTVVVSDD